MSSTVIRPCRTASGFFRDRPANQLADGFQPYCSWIIGPVAAARPSRQRSNARTKAIEHGKRAHQFSSRFVVIAPARISPRAEIEIVDQVVEMRSREIELARGLGDVPVVAARAPRARSGAGTGASPAAASARSGRRRARLREHVVLVQRRRDFSPCARITAASIACASWRRVPGPRRVAARGERAPRDRERRAACAACTPRRRSARRARGCRRADASRPGTSSGTTCRR